MKKVSTVRILWTMLVLIGVAIGGAIFNLWWLVLPLLFFLSGVIVGNLNGEDFKNG
jgi:hypothetical protein